MAKVSGSREWQHWPASFISPRDI